MFYYSSNSPKVGQVVLGYLMNDKEEENCIYVRIPEYDNVEGMIPKSNLPKKRRTFKKVLAKMRKEGVIPCVVKSKPRFNVDGTPWTLDLTLRRIDRNAKQVFIDRVDNIARILKVMKFLSEETTVGLGELCTGLWSGYIGELFADRIVYGTEDNDESDEESSDSGSDESDTDSDNSDSPQQLTDLSDLYQRVAGNPDFVIDTIKAGTTLESETESAILDILNSYSNAKKSDCTINFEFRIDDAEDPVEVLQDVFSKVIEDQPDLTIHYKGAPMYSAIKPDVSPAELEGRIDELRQTFETALSTHSNCNYHLKFSLQDSEAKEPTYSFSFPRMIEL